MNPDFTYAYYKHMLQTLKDAGYRFCSFTEGRNLATSETPLAILRHDVDLEPQAAWEMARLEINIPAMSTYFFMVSSPLYNIFEPNTRKMIEGLHRVEFGTGLHFNYPAYKARQDTVVVTEANILEKIVPVTAVSIHKPDVEKAKSMQLPYPHTYEPIFINGSFEYFSDSGGKWERGSPIDSQEFRDGKNLHILVHPIWWGEVHGSPVHRLGWLMDRIKDRAMKHLEKDCPKAWRGQ